MVDQCINKVADFFSLKSRVNPFNFVKKDSTTAGFPT